MTKIRLLLEELPHGEYTVYVSGRWDGRSDLYDQDWHFFFDILDDDWQPGDELSTNLETVGIRWECLTYEADLDFLVGDIIVIKIDNGSWAFMHNLAHSQDSSFRFHGKEINFS